MTWYPQEYVDKVPMTNMEMRASRGYPGRTYRFYKGKVVFPFGAGHSYTKFKQSLAHSPSSIISIPLLSSPTSSSADNNNATTMSLSSNLGIKVSHTTCDSLNIDLHIDVKNTGEMDGTHTVLVFSSPPDTSNTALPTKQLVAFEKVHVLTGSQRRVMLSINVCKHLSVVDELGVRRIPMGKHRLHMGNDHDDDHHSFDLQIKSKFGNFDYKKSKLDKHSGTEIVIYNQIDLLVETGSDSRTTKLEFKTRISIATGAAKGLWHLHRQRPMVLHGNFKTGNVLVDENFIAKVSGAGVSTLLQSIPPYVGPSHSSDRPTPFTDPHQYTDTDQSGELCEASDVYSFGVFLWELISGREALHIDGLGSNESMLHWVEKHLNEENLVDGRLTAGSFTVEGMGDFIKLAMRCTSFPRRDRPTMEDVVAELEKILDKEIMGTTFMGDEEPTPTVTLGSQLFTN